MRTLEDEAKEIISKFEGATKEHFECVIAGANSKYVQIEKIKAQLDILNSFYYGDDLKNKDIMKLYSELHIELTEELGQQLKELQQ